MSWRHIKRTPIPPIERFMAKVRKCDSGCWEWQGFVNPKGYGMFSKARSTAVQAHKWAYEYFNGVVPLGLELDHLCRNRKCCNPDHMEAVTHLENVRRGIRGLYIQRNHCSQGHQMNDENTWISGRGQRRCRICMRDRARIRAGVKRFASKPTDGRLFANRFALERTGGK